ncbi:MAG: hypothetical protein KAR79_05300 [Simkaniaceae bacterium]|nr:hypothetical protein [Simkaniaceae bacterium]
MKKLLLIFASFLLLCIIAFYCLWEFKVPILAKVLQRKLGVPVTIEALHFHKDQIKIDGLIITNPVRAKTPIAMTVKTVTIDAPYNRYVHDPIVLDKVHLKKVFLNIEFYTKNQEEGNWVTIMHDTSIDYVTPLRIKRSLTIKKLLLTNINMDLFLAGSSKKTLTPIKELSFTDITSEKGIPIHELTEIIVQNLINQVFVLRGLKAIIETPKIIIEGLFAPFRWLKKSNQNKNAPRDPKPANP